jgi:radical SAM protein with 4Fe4S-binding SPASM domain
MQPTVIWELTRACSLHCTHCPIGATGERNPFELSTYEGYKTIDQIADLKPGRLVLSGGDPLVRGDIYQLVEYATRRGLEPLVALSPTAELTRAAVQRLRRNGVKRIVIGVDDFFPPTTTLSAIEWARDCDMAVEINTRVTRRNAEKLPQLLDMIESLGADAWNLYFLVPIGVSAEEMPSPEQVDEIFEFVDEEARQRIHVRILEAPHYARYLAETHAGLRTQDSGLNVFIAFNGDVRPGELVPIGAGNVRYRALGAIVRAGDVFVALRDRTNLKGRCGRCEYVEVCGGSRARAFAMTGDLFASDPLCVYEEE